MINPVVVEYEDFDDAFGFKEFYVKDEGEVRKTMKRIFKALEAEVGTEQAMSAFKFAME